MSNHPVTLKCGRYASETTTTTTTTTTTMPTTTSTTASTTTLPTTTTTTTTTTTSSPPVIKTRTDHIKPQMSPTTVIPIVNLTAGSVITRHNSFISGDVNQDNIDTRINFYVGEWPDHQQYDINEYADEEDDNITEDTQEVPKTSADNRSETEKSLTSSVDEDSNILRENDINLYSAGIEEEYAPNTYDQNSISSIVRAFKQSRPDYDLLQQDEDAVFLNLDEMEDENGVSYDENGVSYDENGVSYDENGVSYDENGVSYDENGVSYDENGVSYDENGVSYDENGVSYDENGVSEEVENGVSEVENGVSEVENGVSEVENGVSEEVENGVSEEVENGLSEDENGASVDWPTNQLWEDDDIDRLETLPPEYTWEQNDIGDTLEDSDVIELDEMQVINDDDDKEDEWQSARMTVDDRTPFVMFKSKVLKDDDIAEPLFEIDINIDANKGGAAIEDAGDSLRPDLLESTTVSTDPPQPQVVEMINSYDYEIDIADVEHFLNSAVLFDHNRTAGSLNQHKNSGNNLVSNSIGDPGTHNLSFTKIEQDEITTPPTPDMSGTTQNSESLDVFHHVFGRRPHQSMHNSQDQLNDYKIPPKVSQYDSSPDFDSFGDTLVKEDDALIIEPYPGDRWNVNWNEVEQRDMEHDIANTPGLVNSTALNLIHHRVQSRRDQQHNVGQHDAIDTGRKSGQPSTTSSPHYKWPLYTNSFSMKSVDPTEQDYITDSNMHKRNYLNREYGGKLSEADLSEAEADPSSLDSLIDDSTHDVPQKPKIDADMHVVNTLWYHNVVPQDIRPNHVAVQNPNWVEQDTHGIEDRKYSEEKIRTDDLDHSRTGDIIPHVNGDENKLNTISDDNNDEWNMAEIGKGPIHYKHNMLPAHNVDEDRSNEVRNQIEDALRKGGIYPTGKTEQVFYGERWQPEPTAESHQNNRHSIMNMDKLVNNFNIRRGNDFVWKTNDMNHEPSYMWPGTTSSPAVPPGGDRNPVAPPGKGGYPSQPIVHDAHGGSSSVRRGETSHGKNPAQLHSSASDTAGLPKHGHSLLGVSGGNPPKPENPIGYRGNPSQSDVSVGQGGNPSIKHVPFGNGGNPSMKVNPIDQASNPSKNSSPIDHGGNPYIKDGLIGHGGFPSIAVNPIGFHGNPSVKVNPIGHSGNPPVKVNRIGHGDNPFVKVNPIGFGGNPSVRVNPIGHGDNRLIKPSGSSIKAFHPPLPVAHMNHGGLSMNLDDTPHHQHRMEHQPPTQKHDKPPEMQSRREPNTGTAEQSPYFPVEQSEVHIEVDDDRNHWANHEGQPDINMIGEQARNIPERDGNHIQVLPRKEPDHQRSNSWDTDTGGANQWELPPKPKWDDDLDRVIQAQGEEISDQEWNGEDDRGELLGRPRGSEDHSAESSNNRRADQLEQYDGTYADHQVNPGLMQLKEEGNGIVLQDADVRYTGLDVQLPTTAATAAHRDGLNAAFLVTPIVEPKPMATGRLQPGNLHMNLVDDSKDVRLGSTPQWSTTTIPSATPVPVIDQHHHPAAPLPDRGISKQKLHNNYDKTVNNIWRGPGAPGLHQNGMIPAPHPAIRRQMNMNIPQVGPLPKDLRRYPDDIPEEVDSDLYHKLKNYMQNLEVFITWH